MLPLGRILPSLIFGKRIHNVVYLDSTPHLHNINKGTLPPLCSIKTIFSSLSCAFLFSSYWCQWLLSRLQGRLEKILAVTLKHRPSRSSGPSASVTFVSPKTYLWFVIPVALLYRLADKTPLCSFNSGPCFQPPDAAAKSFLCRFPSLQVRCDQYHIFPAPSAA